MLIVRILGLAYFYKGTLIRVLDFVQIIARPTLLSLLGVIVICAFDWVNGSGVLSHVLSLFGKSILIYSIISWVTLSVFDAKPYILLRVSSERSYEN